MLYALVDAQNQFVTGRRGNLSPFADFPSRPKDPIGKGWRWLPVEDTDPGAFDPVTQVKEGPQVTIQAAKVTRIWTVRDKTAQEIDADKEAALQAELAAPGIRLFKAFVLAWADQAGLTPAQARASIKAKL